MNQQLSYTTVVEMFDAVTSEYRTDPNPVLMYKAEGEFKGITYDSLRSLVSDFALGLAALGVNRGDAVAIISENRPEWVIADMAIMKLGAISVSIYPTLTAKQIEFILNDAGVRYVVVSNPFQLAKIIRILPAVPQLRTTVIISDKNGTAESNVLTYSQVLSRGKEFAAVHPEYLSGEQKKISPEDILTIIYTSGTTGNPKGVVLTHRNLVSNMRSSATCIPFNHDDIVLSFLPLSHSYERMGAYYTVMSLGGRIAYAESIESVRENLLEVRPTVVTTVPRLFERLYNRLMVQVEQGSSFQRKFFAWSVQVGKRYHSASRAGKVAPLLALEYRISDYLVFRKIRARTGGRIRFFVSGGAALPRELGEFFDAIGIVILEGYGMTESSPVISVNRIDDYKFGTVGKPIPDVEVHIAGDGEILVRGPNVMKGYWNNPAATAEVIDRDGWLRTGDIGHVDEEGFLTITDRKKHLFVSSGGKNIAPQHIEDLFLQSRFIDQFVLIGDGKMYLTALIVPEFSAVREYAARHGMTYENLDELTAKPEITALFEKEIAEIQKHLANFERVRKFTLLRNPLTIENGEITPTMKIRRKVVEARFRDAIEKMYLGVR